MASIKVPPDGVDDPEMSESTQERTFRDLAHPDADAEVVIHHLLGAVRRHLDLEVAFIGEFVGDRRVFRYVDTEPHAEVIAVGDADPLDESYCHYVASGRVPTFLPDPGAHPVTAAMPATQQLPVGTHLSVPIRFSDGRIFGTFCCFSFSVHNELRQEHLKAVELVADLAGAYLEAVEEARAAHRARLELITGVLNDPDAMTLVFQPLWDLEAMEVVGLEALARFPRHDRGPAWFFAEAAKVGLGPELEMVAVRRALRALEQIPEPIRLNVNVAAETLCSEEFFAAVADVPADRLVVEVTEHAAIEDYADLKAASARLGDRGIWLAIDDVGMGFSGLNRILESDPEELKLDAAVIRDVDTNTVKQALVEAFCGFARRAQFQIIAEGIETEHELGMLRSLGVTLGQGYHLARPGPLEDVLPKPDE